MTYDDIIYEADASPVASITLNRPAALNAYTSRMCRELVDALDRYQRNDAQRVLVITGAGRGFCAGGDLASQDEVIEAEGRQFGHGMIMREGMHAVIRTLHRIDKPVIAMVNGVAVAGGLTLALMCDVRIAGTSARMGDTSGRAALLPDEGGAWLFPRAMGLERALRMTWLNEIYDAHTARELGLVSEVVGDDDLARHVTDFAERLASRGPLAVRMSKRLMRRAIEGSLEQALGDAELAVDIVNDSSDVHEGVAAFLEKRTPNFEGR